MYVVPTGYIYFSQVPPRQTENVVHILKIHEWEGGKYLPRECILNRLLKITDSSSINLTKIEMLLGFVMAFIGNPPILTSKRFYIWNWDVEDRYKMWWRHMKILREHMGMEIWSLLKGRVQVRATNWQWKSKKIEKINYGWKEVRKGDNSGEFIRSVHDLSPNICLSALHVCLSNRLFIP